MQQKPPLDSKYIDDEKRSVTAENNIDTYHTNIDNRKELPIDSITNVLTNSTTTIIGDSLSMKNEHTLKNNLNKEKLISKVDSINRKELDIMKPLEMDNKTYNHQSTTQYDTSKTLNNSIHINSNFVMDTTSSYSIDNILSKRSSSPNVPTVRIPIQNNNNLLNYTYNGGDIQIKHDIDYYKNVDKESLPNLDLACNESSSIGYQELLLCPPKLKSYIDGDRKQDYHHIIDTFKYSIPSIVSSCKNEQNITPISSKDTTIFHNQTHKVPSSFQQAKLHTSFFKTINDTSHITTKVTINNPNSDHIQKSSLLEQPSIVDTKIEDVAQPKLEPSLSTTITSSMPIEDQFKPMDCGFKRIIARSKYGSETKVLKKFVIYIAPSNDEIELRSKRDVSRFLKSQPNDKYYLTPEHFNFDNTIHFNLESRTIGKVPRLKKCLKSIELIIDKDSSDLPSNSLNSSNVSCIDGSLLPTQISNVSQSEVCSFDQHNSNLYSDISIDRKTLDDSTSLESKLAQGIQHSSKTTIKKRGRPKGTSTKLSHNKIKKMKTLDNANTNDIMSISARIYGNKSKKYTNAHNSDIFSSRTKMKKNKYGDNNTKYVKSSKRTFNDQLLEQPQQLPRYICLSYMDIFNYDKVNTTNSKQCYNINDTTIANLMNIFEFLNEFSIIFPLNNRLNAIPPFESIIEDVITTTHDHYSNSVPTALDHIKSPLLRLCDCLLETYLYQKLPLPSILHDIKLEFDIHYKYNNINICSIIRILIEEHLLNISQFEHALSFGYNKDLLDLANQLKTSSILQLRPILKSTFVLFLINNLMNAPNILNNIDTMVENFTVTRSAKWNLESFIRKLSRHMAILKQTCDNTTNPNDQSTQSNDNVINHSGNYVIVTNENSQPITMNDVTDQYVDLKVSEPHKSTPIDNKSEYIDDHQDDELDEDDSIADNDEDDDKHLSSKKISKNRISVDSGIAERFNVSSIDDEMLLDALHFNVHSLKLPNSIDECAQLCSILEAKQKVLKDWSFGFFRRIKGISMGQDRFSRYYSIPFHSSSVFVEYNPREMEFDNFINSNCNVNDSNKYIIDSNIIMPILNETIWSDNKLHITTNDSLSNIDSKVTIDDDNIQGELLTNSIIPTAVNDFPSLMLIDNLNDFNEFAKHLNVFGMKERSLSKQFSRNTKNMSKSTLTSSSFYKALAGTKQYSSHTENQSNRCVSKKYCVPIENIIELEYRQIFDYICMGNIFTQDEINNLTIPSNLAGDNFVEHMKSTLINLIHVLDTKGMIVLVKKAKTNSKESKSRYVKSLTDFIAKIGDCYIDLELVLISLQLNVSYELLNNTDQKLVSPFNNKCCSNCHLNVNFECLLSCIYCYITFHSYCQGYDQDISNIVEDEWCCNHCRNHISTEGLKLDFLICPECNEHTTRLPQNISDDDQHIREIDNNNTINIIEEPQNMDLSNVSSTIKCALCLYYYHTECVQERNITDKLSEYFLCSTCNEVCRMSKALSESGRKRISKKLKIDIIDNFVPCHKILNELIRHPCAEDFTKPVDLEKHPLYAQIIKKPIDLIQIRQNLLNLNYSNQEEFVVDVRLVFENCKRFNQCDSEIYVSGRKMAYFFENRWNYIISKVNNQITSQE